jgi:hypothetical protein
VLCYQPQVSLPSYAGNAAPGSTISTQAANPKCPGVLGLTYKL